MQPASVLPLPSDDPPSRPELSVALDVVPTAVALLSDTTTEPTVRDALLQAVPPRRSGLGAGGGLLRPDAIELDLVGNLLDRMLYYSLHGLEAHARALAVRWAGHPWHVARALLVASVARSRAGDVAGATAEQEELLERVAAWPDLLARTKIELGATLERVGDRTRSARLMQDALETWPEGVRPGWRAEALMVFACSLISREGTDTDLVRRVVEEVREHCDRLLYATTLANFAELFAECDDLALSTEFADEAGALLERHPEVIVPLTLDSIARSRLAVGELSRAEFCLTMALDLERELGCTDVNGDPWLTFAEVRLAQGSPDEALALLDHPRRAAWAAKTAWSACRDMRVRASILAAQQRWEQAYRALLKHSALYERVRSLEGDRAVAESEGRQVAAQERRRAAQFEALAMSDPLTALPNRRAVDRWLATEAGARHGQVGVAIIDLDHFKSINDRFGHEVGDRVLQRVSETLRRFAIRPGRAAGRLGGEEFVVLDADPDDDLVAHVEAILMSIRNLDLTDLAPGLTMTASAGVAVCPDGSGVPDLLRTADEQLYRAKRAGRDRLASVRT